MGWKYTFCCHCHKFTNAQAISYIDTQAISYNAIHQNLSMSFVIVSIIKYKASVYNITSLRKCYTAGACFEELLSCYRVGLISQILVTVKCVIKFLPEKLRQHYYFTLEKQ